MDADTAAVWKFVNDMFNDNAKTYSEDRNSFFAAVKSHYDSKPELFQDWRENVALRNRLVKVCCMLHDTRETEYCNLAFKMNDSQKSVTMFLRDNLDVNSNDVQGDPILFDRYCHVMVPIPGASSWFIDEKLANAGSPAKRSRKEGSPIELPHFVAKFVVDGENLKANTAMTLYGLLTEENHMNDEEGTSLGTAHMPSLHVISHSLHDASVQLADTFSAEEATTARDVLCTRLAELMGDPTSAKYLLAHLISKAYARPNGALPISSLPLNICGVSDSSVLVAALRELMPKVKHVQLTPDLLSDKHFAPTKDHAADSLLTGEMQVSNGTLVILDETKLPEGSFTVRGHVEKNLKVMEQHLMEQRISYDYQFNQIAFDVDAPLLILSKKISGLFKTPFVVPMAPMQSHDVLNNFKEGIDNQRKYVQAMRNRIQGITLDGESNKEIQQLSVERMKNLPADTNKASLMSCLLLLTRITAAASGSEKMLPKHFNDAVTMEKQREELLTEWLKQNVSAV